MVEKSFSFRARGAPVIGLRSEPHACFLRGYAGESEATRDRIAGGAVLEKRVSFPPLAAGHIGKKLQFPRTRRSRDRIAERAIRGGGPCHQSMRQLPAHVLFAGRRRRVSSIPRARLSRDRVAGRAASEKRVSFPPPQSDCGGPWLKKASVSARAELP